MKHQRVLPITFRNRYKIQTSRRRTCDSSTANVLTLKTLQTRTSNALAAQLQPLGKASCKGKILGDKAAIAPGRIEMVRMTCLLNEGVALGSKQ